MVEQVDFLRYGQLRTHGGAYGNVFSGLRSVGDEKMVVVNPYFVWSDEQEIRVVRVWGAGTDMGTMSKVYIDVLLDGADPTLEASWKPVVLGSGNVTYTGTGSHPGMMDIDLGKVYSTAGIRVRVEVEKLPGSPGYTDTRYCISEVQIFGDLGGASGQGSFANFYVSEIPNSWQTSSMRQNVNQLLYGKGGDRWTSTDRTGNAAKADLAAGGKEAYWLSCAFDGKSLNAMEICWQNKTDDNLYCEMPAYWQVWYTTTENPQWQLAGTYEKTMNGFSCNIGSVLTPQPTLMYLCDLGNLDGVTNLQIVIPYDALDPANGLGIFQVGFFDIPALRVPEPATMGLLVLGGLAMLRRRK